MPEVFDGSRHVERLATQVTQLPGGLLLVVATDSFDVQQLRYRLGHFTIWSGIVIAAFALIGGYLVGRVFLRRLATVNRAIDRIIDGDGAERLPMIGFGPEFDDLTRNLNRMLERKAAAMEALRQVSTDIAHDLRTPLTRLHQRLERLQVAGAGDADSIDAAVEQTNGLLATFEALLRIGSIEGGVGRRRFATVDLTELLDRIHAAYVPVVEDSGQTFIANHSAGVTVIGDPDLLAQLFTNLIENAIVHTRVERASFPTCAPSGPKPWRRYATTVPASPPMNVRRSFDAFTDGMPVAARKARVLAWRWYQPSPPFIRRSAPSRAALKACVCGSVSVCRLRSIR